MEYSEADLGRRDFLRVGSLSFLGISLSQYLMLRDTFAARVDVAAPKAQACILLWLEGGPSQVDTWDPKPGSSFKPISTNVPGIQISELFPRSAEHMDKLSILRSMHTEEIDHPEATHYAVTGHRPNSAMKFPSLGSIITKETGVRSTIPAHVIVPEWNVHRIYEEYFGSSFLGPKYSYMGIPDPSQKDFRMQDLSLPKTLSLERVEDRMAFRKVVDRIHRQKEEIAEFAQMDTFTAQALKMILSTEVKAAFDLSREPEKIRDHYGRNSFGQSVLLARRLVESGSRFVTAAGYKFNHWDSSHKDNDRYHRDELAPPLDQALSALLEDLSQRGLLQSTVVIVMGEFGRTPHTNPDNGRDHWPHCWSLLLGGGGIAGGRVVGSSDGRGAYVADRMITMGDVFATIYKAFGIDWTKEYMSPIGRPLKIANAIDDKTGVPIKELI